MSVNQLPRIPGIDWDVALSFTGDIELLKDVVEDVYNNIEPYAEELTSLYEAFKANPNELTRTSYRVRVHSMKSTMALIGCGLSEAAKELEYAARDGKDDTIMAKTEGFLIKWRGYRELLEEVLEKKSHTLEFDRELFMDALENIDTAMDSFDLDVADSEINEIDNMIIPDEFKDGVDKLRMAVRSLDDDRVHELVRELKSL